MRLPVEDYLYGDAPVTVRIVGIDDNLDRIPGLEWIRILAADTARPGAKPYPIIVRATALRRPGA
ncbi:hypothetical protein [Plantactinospora sp. B5E13]|uniref:hypothetical protein n=1 Tax=unclassified Plantactinospora TaxID=2631981 RepID=UPI00325D2479